MRACPWAKVRGLAHEQSMTKKTHTLMVVHAHPDDEASSTGGLLRFAAEQGHTTIVVTCTQGDLGEVRIRPYGRERVTRPHLRRHASFFPFGTGTLSRK